jgi:hypothetical protein
MECGDHGQPGQIVMQPVGTVKLTEHATVITLPRNTAKGIFCRNNYTIQRCMSN